MLTIRSDVSVPSLTGLQITDFLLEPTDARYQAWWPGTHLRFHLVRPGRPDHRGDAVYMDEIVGRRRIRHTAVVTGAVPGSRIVWRLGWRIPLPIRLTLNMTDTRWKGDGWACVVLGKVDVPTLWLLVRAESCSVSRRGRRVPQWHDAERVATRVGTSRRRKSRGPHPMPAASVRVRRGAVGCAVTDPAFARPGQKAPP